MCPGLYGKLPSQGDFVSRRLPWEFTSGWDDWLQGGMSEAKRQLGDAWLERYLTAPIWRFQLAPGVLGATGWIGLWFPSVDRVGRHFPFTLAVPLPVDQAHRYRLLELDSTFLEWEDTALRALDPRLGFDALDESIQLLPEPPGLHTDEGAARPLPPATSEAPETVVFDNAADISIVLGQVRSLPVRSCFFSWGSDGMAPTLCRCAALPPSSTFHTFFDGQRLTADAE